MPHFHFEAELFVDRSLDEVRAFFADVNSLVRWDRSVSKVVCASPAPLAAGARFATIGPFRGGREGKRSEYQVVAVSDNESKVALIDSPMFQSAVWTTRFSAEGRGTQVTCQMEMSTDLLRAPIAALLKLNAKAIATDLQFLKRALENGEVAKR